ncbi:MAG: tripartite tricarboxylate transporter TctB family protein [Aliihoeflea sp.]
MTARYSLKNLLAGLIFVGFGLAFGYAASNYQIGTALRMGPGYFPIILAVIMVILGVIIVVQSFLEGADEIRMDAVPWRGVVLLVGALVFFGFTVRGLGLLPSLFVTVFLAGFASRSNGIFGALTLAVGLTALCMVIFIWALGLPLPLFGPWLAALGL